MSDEAMIAAILSGSDYESPASFSTDPSYDLDYLIPRSRLERWEAAQAAYEAMQHEIDQVMEEQRERVSALRAERRGPKTPMEDFIETAYSKLMTFALQQRPLLRDSEKEPE